MQKQDIDKINQDVDGKIDRNELDSFRDYMEKQLKKLKKLAVSVVRALIPQPSSMSLFPSLTPSPPRRYRWDLLPSLLHSNRCLFVFCFMCCVNEERSATNSTTCTYDVRRRSGRSPKAAYSLSLHQLWSSDRCSTTPVRVVCFYWWFFGFSLAHLSSCQNSLLGNNRAYPQTRVCVPSSHPDRTQPTNWTKYANIKRGRLVSPTNNEQHVETLVLQTFVSSQQFSNEFSGGMADVYATVRQCGGSHTMTLPFKRQIKTQ